MMKNRKALVAALLIIATYIGYKEIYTDVRVTAINSSWFVIQNSNSKCGNVGLKESLEFLHANNLSLERVNIESSGLGCLLDLSNIDLAKRFSIFKLTDDPYTHAFSRYANLRGIEFKYVNMENANMDYAVMFYCKMKGVIAKHSSFRNAFLSHCNLSDVDLSGVDAESSRFNKASLVSLKAVYGNFRNADFRGADLTNANFNNSKMHGADFSGAIVEGVNFDNTEGVACSDFKNAIYSELVLEGMRCP